MATKYSIEAIFKAVDRISAPVSRMQNRIGKLTRKMEGGLKGVNRITGKVTAGLKKIGAVGAVAFAAAGTAAVNVIRVGADFQQTLVAAAAKFPGTIKKGTDAYARLEAAARQVGKTTEFTASQSAQALNYLAMAGFNVENAIAALPGVVDLATTSQMDLAEATDIASDTLGAFNLMSEDSVQLGKNLARVNDVMAKTANMANTSIAQMFEAVSEAGPVADTAGVSLEQFGAMVGILGSASIKGSKAGTTLKNVYLNLAAPAGEAAKVLKRLGVATQDQDGNMLDMFTILGRLNKSLAKYGSAQKSAYLKTIFGKIPIAGVNILLKAGERNLRDYSNAVEDSVGYNKLLADIMRDTVLGRLKGLGSAIESVKISLFSLTEGPLTDVLDRMIKWVRLNETLISTKIGEWLLWVADNFQLIVTRAKQVGIVIAALTGIIAALKVFTIVMAAVNMVMSANPITLVILGLIAFGALIAHTIANFDKFKTKFQEMPGWVKAAIFLLSGPLGWLAGIVYLIMDNWGELKVFFADLFGWIKELVSTAVGYWAEKLTKIKSWIPFSDKIFGPTETTGPQRRAAAVTSESKTSAEVTIKPAAGVQADITRGRMGPGLTLSQSGAF